MELPGIVLVAISISLSAKTYWAFTVQSNGVGLTTVGALLSLFGAAGIFVSAFVFSTSRSSETTHHTFDRQVSDLNGGLRSIHQGMRQLTLKVLSSATSRPPRQILPARGTSIRRHTTVAARSY